MHLCFRRHATSSLSPPRSAQPLHYDGAFRKKIARVSSLCWQRSKRKRLHPRRETRSTPACPRCLTQSALTRIRCPTVVTHTRFPGPGSQTKCTIRACPTWAHATICTSFIATTSWAAAAATALSSRPKMSFRPKKCRRSPHTWSPAYRGCRTSCILLCSSSLPNNISSSTCSSTFPYRSVVHSCSLLLLRVCRKMNCTNKPWEAILYSVQERIMGTLACWGTKVGIVSIILVVHIYLKGKRTQNWIWCITLQGVRDFEGFFTLSSPEGIQITAKNIVSSSVHPVNTNQVWNNVTRKLF